MARIPLGLQLYSVREDCARNLPETLRSVADMGYEGVEFAGADLATVGGTGHETGIEVNSVVLNLDIADGADQVIVQLLGLIHLS